MWGCVKRYRLSLYMLVYRGDAGSVVICAGLMDAGSVGILE